MGIDFPQISENQKNVLDSPITLQELKIAILSMNNDKCPGLDGYPIEFYKTFWTDLSPTLHSLMLRYSTSFTMNSTAKQGVISLLDKPNKDLLQVRNWRPLTMLNCDYKIYAKIIANRLQLVIPDIIHEDQKGFVKGRSTAHNLEEIAICHRIFRK